MVKFKKKYILGIIPARGGSVGIKNKNIFKIFGKELIKYTLEDAKKSTKITHLLLSTDSKKIHKVAKDRKIFFLGYRPKRLSGKKSNIIDVLKFETLKLERVLGTKFYYVALLQPTSPIRNNNLIDKSINKIQRNNGDSLISLAELNEPHPIKLKKIKNNKVLDYVKWEIENPARQSLPKLYRPTGAIYIVKRDILIKKSSLKGKRVIPFIVKNDDFVNIDEIKDIEIFKLKLREKK